MVKLQDDVLTNAEQYLLDDGTLVIWTDFELFDVSRINICQKGTHYGDLYYRDEED